MTKYVSKNQNLRSIFLSPPAVFVKNHKKANFAFEFFIKYLYLIKMIIRVSQNVHNIEFHWALAPQAYPICLGLLFPKWYDTLWSNKIKVFLWSPLFFF